MGFKNFHIFAQNPRVLGFGFTENHQFGAKTDRNTIFLGRDPNILDMLNIMVLRLSFYRFSKFSIFTQNP
jgi:hypothetical protein